MKFNIRETSHPRFFLLMVLVLTCASSSANAQFLDNNEPLDFEKVFKEGLQRRGKYLNLSGKKIGDEGLKLLGRQKWLPKVTKIDLRYNEITPEGANILAKYPALPKLKVLILRHNFFADEGTVILAKNEKFPNLVEMQLGWNEIRDAGALAIAGSKSFSKLQKLDLRGNFLSDRTKQQLRKTLARFKSLKLY